MEPQRFRKLRMHLPRQPLSKQRPWLIAGLLLVFIIVLIAAYGYITRKKRSVSPEQPVKVALKT